MFSILRSRKGVSLTELMVTVSILVIVITPVSLLFNSVYRNYFIEEDTVDAQEQARYAMDTILSDIAKHDNSNIHVSTLNELVIIPDKLIYGRDSDKIIRKNPSALTEEIVCTDVVNFKVDINNSLADPLVELEIETQKGRGRKVSLKNSYRIKSN